MPIKKISNTVKLREDSSAVLSFFTFNKKAHFESESKLYDSLISAISGVDVNAVCHLTTYPYIAVHIQHGIQKVLDEKGDQFKKAVEDTLACWIKS